MTNTSKSHFARRAATTHGVQAKRILASAALAVAAVTMTPVMTSAASDLQLFIVQVQTGISIAAAVQTLTLEYFGPVS